MQPKSEIKLRGKGVQKCEYTMDEYNPKQKWQHLDDMFITLRPCLSWYLKI